jgi:fructokinase
MEKILCIGEALIDMICTDKGTPLSEGQHFLRKPGGAPANVAIAIAALGGEAELVAKVGADPFGKHLVDILQAAGVGVRWVLKDEEHFTTLAFVSLMENGEKDFYFNRGADGQLSEKDIDGIDLDGIAIFHFGSATAFLPGPLQQSYLALLAKAQSLGRFVSFDPNYRHLLFKGHTASFIEQAWKFLAVCDFFKLSDEEALLLTDTSALSHASAILLERTKGVFAITLGKDGTLLGLNGQTHIVESIEINQVDTTGAGDAFVGAVLCQLEEENLAGAIRPDLDQWKKIIYNANKAGARTCEYFGAMEAFRHLSRGIFKD